MLSGFFFASKPIQIAGAKSIPTSDGCNSNNFSSCSGNQLLLSLSHVGLPLPTGQDMALNIEIDI